MRTPPPPRITVPNKVSHTLSLTLSHTHTLNVSFKLSHSHTHPLQYSGGWNEALCGNALRCGALWRSHGTNSCVEPTNSRVEPLERALAPLPKIVGVILWVDWGWCVVVCWVGGLTLWVE